MVDPVSSGLQPSVSRAGAPTVNDDFNKGFVVGSVWRNTATAPDTVYTCVDNTIGAAVWTGPTGASPTKAGVPGINDDSTQGYAANSLITNTSATPKAAYICTDPTPGAAKWLLLGAAVGLIAFATSGSVDSAVALSPLTSPTNSAVSNGTIGGP